VIYPRHRNGLKILRAHAIDCLVNPQDLSDDECWKFRVAHGVPDPYQIPRDLAINCIRKLLGPWAPIDGLEFLERQLAVDGEHKLAAWLRRLRQERQSQLTQAVADRVWTRQNGASRGFHILAVKTRHARMLTRHRAIQS
jgi:hypothetical protein